MQVEKSEREKLEKDEYSISEAQNLELLKVEEDQFQQYADQVISQAKSRNINIYPLKKASKRGTGQNKCSTIYVTHIIL